MYLAWAWMPYSHMRIVLSSEEGGRQTGGQRVSEGAVRQAAARSIDPLQHSGQHIQAATRPSSQPAQPALFCAHTRGSHKAAVLVDEGHGVDGGQVVIVDLLESEGHTQQGRSARVRGNRTASCWQRFGCAHHPSLPTLPHPSPTSSAAPALHLHMSPVLRSHRPMPAYLSRPPPSPAIMHEAAPHLHHVPLC